MDSNCHRLATKNEPGDARSNRHLRAAIKEKSRFQPSTKSAREASSDEVLAQVFAAEDVHVEVHDGLAGVDALVGDDAETVLQALGLSDLLDGVSHGAHGLGRYVVGDVAVVLLGDHERVDRRLRVEVVEGDDLVVLIDNGRGDLVVGDFAEDAITHGWFLSHRPR